MKDCLFCKIVAGKIPSTKIYEDKSVYAFLDINPVSPGHTLVIPKIHTPNIYEAPDNELKNIVPILKKIAKAVKAAVKADGVNVTFNNDPAAGQVIFHLHAHIIPRFDGDGHDSWKQGAYKSNEQEKMGEKIEKML